MSVGSITYQSTSIPFLAVITPAGMIADQAMAQAEELITPGINGRRWRTLFSQFPSFEMRTFTEASDYATGVFIKRQAENLAQKLTRLSATISTTTYQYRDVHVTSAAAIIHPGPIVGAGAGSGLAHVEIVWQLELTDFGIG